MVDFAKHVKRYWPLTTVISGGQTGADQAGWRAAKALGYNTFGYMPQGYLTEVGCMPQFATEYGAQVHPDALSYDARTALNIEASSGTVLFGRLDTPGARLAVRVLRQKRRPKLYLAIEDPELDALAAATVQAWIRTNTIQVLNVAGNRESTNPGIGATVEAFLVQALRRPTDDR
jgi:hypothetical protein